MTLESHLHEIAYIYNSKDINYDRRGFIRLKTNLEPLNAILKVSKPFVLMRRCPPCRRPVEFLRSKLSPFCCCC